MNSGDYSIILRFLMISQEFCANLRNSVDFCGILGISVDFSGFLVISVEFC